MRLQDVLFAAINARKNRALRVAKAALPDSQFWAFRGLFLDEFGQNGLEREVERIVADYEKLSGKDTGRPIHAGKEVPHD
ncbi:hypothetical protein [Rhodoferax sediminis]|uniref:Uncharacterized protein n=1 Tax=Rhodoferax sediminis TaxID=2509614 RepID=A0A515DAX1_9BURK|nr:hypothetical protein [Rhodoferax sediminis]QDL37545.1 hypothetical protein EUB48_09895 [Rhodoferax sediminis]